MERTASGVARCIRLARAGGTDALSDLLGAYRGYLRVLASTCIDPAIRSKVDASDVVQEALFKAHREFAQFRGASEKEWLAWLRSIVAHRLTDLHRHFAYPGKDLARERRLDGLLERSSQMLRNLVAAPGPSPSEDAVERERGVMLADALDGLDADDREVLVLRSLQELEWTEVARRMQRTPDAARMQWTRALGRLGDALKERMR